MKAEGAEEAPLDDALSGGVAGDGGTVAGGLAAAGLRGEYRLCMQEDFTGVAKNSPLVETARRDTM